MNRRCATFPSILSRQSVGFLSRPALFAAALTLPASMTVWANPPIVEPGCQTCQDALLAAPSCETGNCGSSVSAGDLVYLFSGEFHQQFEDLRIPGRQGAPNFVWGRKYRSRLGADTAQGNGWDFSYNIRIEQSGPDIIVHDGNTRADVYSPQPDGSWTRAEFYRVLTAEAPCASDLTGDGVVNAADLALLLGQWGGPGSADFTGDSVINASDLAFLLANWGPCNPTPLFFQLTFPDTSVWQFFPFDGGPTASKLKAIVDRNENSLTFSYDALGRLVTITDTLNRDITIAYNGDGFIQSVTDFDSPPRQIQYAYYNGVEPGGSFGDLKSVTSPIVVGTGHNDFPNGKTTIYTYSTGFADERLNHNLLTITDPNGQLYLTNVYSPILNEFDVLNFDHVIRQVWGTQDNGLSDPGDVIDFTYFLVGPTAANNFATSMAVVNDRVGNVKHFFFDQGNRNVIFQEYTGRANPDLPTTLALNLPVNPLRQGVDPLFFETRATSTTPTRA